MATVQLYVGANNLTGEVDRDDLIKILNDRHLGYTLAEATGMWQGKAEPSVIVTLADDLSKIKQTAWLIKVALEQDAVGMVTLPDMEFVS